MSIKEAERWMTQLSGSHLFMLTLDSRLDMAFFFFLVLSLDVPSADKINYHTTFILMP